MNKKHNWQEGDRVYVNIAQPIPDRPNYFDSVPTPGIIEALYARMVGVRVGDTKYLFNRSKLRPRADTFACDYEMTPEGKVLKEGRSL